MFNFGRNLGEIFKVIMDFDPNKSYDWIFKIYVKEDKTPLIIGLVHQATNLQLLEFVDSFVNVSQNVFALEAIPRDITSEDYYQKIFGLLRDGCRRDPNEFADLYVWTNEDPPRFEGHLK